MEVGLNVGELLQIIRGEGNMLQLGRKKGGGHPAKSSTPNFCGIGVLFLSLSE